MAGSAGVRRRRRTLRPATFLVLAQGQRRCHQAYSQRRQTTDQVLIVLNAIHYRLLTLTFYLCSGTSGHSQISDLAANHFARTKRHQPRKVSQWRREATASNTNATK